jgi:hypothetical protein
MWVAGSTTACAHDYVPACTDPFFACSLPLVNTELEQRFKSYVTNYGLPRSVKEIIEETEAYKDDLESEDGLAHLPANGLPSPSPSPPPEHQVTSSIHPTNGPSYSSGYQQNDVDVLAATSSSAAPQSPVYLAAAIFRKPKLTPKPKAASSRRVPISTRTTRSQSSRCTSFFALDGRGRLKKANLKRTNVSLLARSSLSLSFSLFVSLCLSFPISFLFTDYIGVTGTGLTPTKKFNPR